MKNETPMVCLEYEEDGKTIRKLLEETFYEYLLQVLSQTECHEREDGAKKMGGIR